MFPNGGVTAPTTGETTPAPGNLVNRDFTAERPNEKWLTDITEIKARDGKVYLSPMIDCHDGKIVAYTACFHPNAELANRMLAEAAETLPDNARPVVHSDRGCHYRWPGWLELMERYGLTRSMSAKGCSPDNAAAEGFFGRMKTESVYPEHWEKRTRDEVLVLIDEYIHWYNHERIKTVAGLDESGTIPSKPGNGCVTISKKTSAAPYRRRITMCDLSSSSLRGFFYCDRGYNAGIRPCQESRRGYNVLRIQRTAQQ